MFYTHLYPGVFFLLVLTTTVTAADTSIIVPSAPQVNARAYLLMDFQSGRILAEKNTSTPFAPASLTKIMTTYVVANEIAQGKFKLDDEVLISERAWKMTGSKMYIEVGKKVSVEDLLRGVIIQSGNDASVALAEFVAGSEEVFADLMNRYAKKIGMQDSKFFNSSGFPHPEHVSSARDLALLSAQLIRNFPEIYQIHTEKSFTYNNIQQNNRNKLLWQDSSVDGIKTGHTEDAGYCLISSASRDKMRLIAVVMGSETEASRLQASKALLGYGFRYFETDRVQMANTAIEQVPVWQGQQKSVPIGLIQDLILTFPRGAQEQLEFSVTVSEKNVAPIAAMQKMGTLEVTYQDRLLAARDLVALQEVAEGGIWRRTIDSIRLRFQ